MKYLIYTLAIIILVGLNVGLFSNLQIFSQIPNLLLLFTICASLEKRNNDFFFVAFVCGMFLDFYSASFFGTFTVSFLLLALFLNFLSNTFVVLELNWKSLALMLLGALLLLNAFSWLYGYLAYRFHVVADYNTIKNFGRVFLVMFIYNALLLYPTFMYYDLTKRVINGLSLRRIQNRV